LFGVLFYLLFVLLVSNHYSLDVSLIQGDSKLRGENIEQQQVGSKASDP
jgi:hypothetical protein